MSTGHCFVGLPMFVERSSPLTRLTRWKIHPVPCTVKALCLTLWNQRLLLLPPRGLTLHSSTFCPHSVWGMSGKIPAILNISRTGNLEASQRRPYCASVNGHSPVGLVSRQWDTVYWACVLCDRRIHNDRASRSASSRQCACPFYSSRACFFLANRHIT